MKLLRTYKTKIPSFTHYLEDTLWVVDKSCLIPHPHENVGVEVTIQYPGEIDFKTIKEKVETELKKYTGNIGKKSIETIIRELHADLKLAFGNLPDQYIRIEIQETERYGVKIE